MRLSAPTITLTFQGILTYDEAAVKKAKGDDF